MLLAEQRVPAPGSTAPTRTLLFNYDENNSPVGYQFRSNTSGGWYHYVFAKNAQGDITTIYRRDVKTDGTLYLTHIADYEYDPWGKVLSIKDASGQDLSSNPNSSAVINPLRYRGYYYDSDSGFYYLQSRYYDPQISRFINADNYSSTGQDFLGYNMFAYCGNNPIVREDRNGEFWNFIVGAVVGAIVNAVTTAADAIKENGWSALGSGKTWAKIGVSAATGAVGGAVAASGIGLGAAAAWGAGTAAVESCGIQLIDTGRIDAEQLLVDTTVGAVSGAVGGKGAIYKNKVLKKQASRWAKHVGTDGIKKATRFAWKMTTKQSKKYILGTGIGIARSWLGGRVTRKLAARMVEE